MKSDFKDYIFFVFLIVALNFMGPMALFLPAPIFVYRDKFPIPYFFLFSFLPFPFIFFLAPDRFNLFFSLLHYCCLVYPSILFVSLLRLKWMNFFERFFPAAILMFLILVSFFFGFYRMSGTTAFSMVIDKFLQLNNVSKGDAEYLKNILFYLFYGIMFLTEGVVFVFNMLFFIKDTGFSSEFHQFKTPVYFVIFTIFFMILLNFFWFSGYLKGEIGVLFATIGFFIFFVFFIQGLSILFFVFNVLNIKGFAKAFLIVLIFIYPIPVILAFTGIFDFWFDFRKKIKVMGGGKVV